MASTSRARIAPAGRGAPAWRARSWIGSAALAVASLGAGGAAMSGCNASQELPTVRAHDDALEKAASNGRPRASEPGRAVVNLVPAVAGLSPREPATIRVGGRSAAWTRSSGAEVDLEPGRQTVSVDGPYLFRPVTVERADAGVRVELPVIPFGPFSQWPPLERRLEVELSTPSTVTLRWKQGRDTVLTIEELPRSPDLSGAALATKFGQDWDRYGGHKYPDDPKFDHAVVRVPPGTAFADVVLVADALLATKRTVGEPSKQREQSVFSVTVQPPAPVTARPVPPVVAAPARPIKLRGDAPMISGRLGRDAIMPVIAAREPEVRHCYHAGLVRAPALEGKVAVRFVIGADGSTSAVEDQGSDLPDAATVTCIVRTFEGLSFARPQGGIVPVKFVYELAPR